MELKETGQKIVEYGKPHWKMFASAFLFFTLAQQWSQRSRLCSKN